VRLASATFPAELSAQVRLVIKRMLPTGQCSLKKVAEELSMNPRTLQRHLQNDDLVFSDIMESVRKEKARELLENSMLPLSHIATELGYAEQAVFNRACKRWFASTPKAMRSRLRGSRRKW
jgi:AraC-like DNA-binding protein